MQRGREKLITDTDIGSERCNRPTYWGGFEGEGIDFSDTGDIAVGEDAVSAIIETIRRFPGEITIST